MANLTGRCVGKPFAEANTVYLMDPDVVEYVPLDFSQTGMVADGHAGIATGTHMGDVDVEVEVWDASPPAVLADWQDVVETSLEWPGERMEITGDSGVDEVVFRGCR